MTERDFEDVIAEYEELTIYAEPVINGSVSTAEMVQLTPDEIQALRHQHRKGDYGQCEACDGNGWAPLGEYPCDVIQLLEAFDELKWVLELALNDLREVESRLEAKSCHGGQTGKFCSECGEEL